MGISISFPFVATEALDPSTATPSDIVTALIAEGLLLDGGHYFMLISGTDQLRISGTDALLIQ